MMWILGLSNVWERCGRVRLLALMAALLSFAVAPIGAQEDTPTPSAVATSAPDYTCVDYGSSERSPTNKRYLKFPATNHLPAPRTQTYSDPECENSILIEWENATVPLTIRLHSGGMAYAHNRNAAWEICEANNTQKLAFIDGGGPSPTSSCYVSDEPAQPGGSTERFLRLHYSTEATEAEALEDCKRKNMNSNAVIREPNESSPWDWVCLESWTVEPESEPSPANPLPGCIALRSDQYYLFPSSKILVSPYTYYDSNQCDSALGSISDGSQGYVLTADGQSAAEALCQDVAIARDDTGDYRTEHRQYRHDFYAC